MNFDLPITGQVFKPQLLQAFNSPEAFDTLVRDIAVVGELQTLQAIVHTDTEDTKGIVRDVAVKVFIDLVRYSSKLFEFTGCPL